MFGFKSREVTATQETSLDLAKLMFDTFSKRVATVEENIKGLSTQLADYRKSTERSQLSDLVLLERIQRTEQLLTESFNWTKRLIELIEVDRSSRVGTQANAPHGLGSAGPEAAAQQITVGPIVSPIGEAGTLASLTTPTELQVLSLLAEKGAVSAPEIGRSVGRSREHTARLMKRLYEEGYVKRDQNRIPFRYSLSERVKQSFSKSVKETAQKVPSEEEAREEAAVPPQA